MSEPMSGPMESTNPGQSAMQEIRAAGWEEKGPTACRKCGLPVIEFESPSGKSGYFDKESGRMHIYTCAGKKYVPGPGELHEGVYTLPAPPDQEAFLKEHPELKEKLK